MTDLQSEVAVAADHAEAHATAPSLLLQAQAALGALSASADAATLSGRRPYRVPEDWTDKLGTLGYLLYLIGDQTGVSIEDAVRTVVAQVTASADRRAAEVSRSDGRSWI